MSFHQPPSHAPTSSSHPPSVHQSARGHIPQCLSTRPISDAYKPTEHQQQSIESASKTRDKLRTDKIEGTHRAAEPRMTELAAGIERQKSPSEESLTSNGDDIDGPLMKWFTSIPLGVFWEIQEKDTMMFREILKRDSGRKLRTKIEAFLFEPKDWPDAWRLQLRISILEHSLVKEGIEPLLQLITDPRDDVHGPVASALASLATTPDLKYQVGNALLATKDVLQEDTGIFLLGESGKEEAIDIILKMLSKRSRSHSPEFGSLEKLAKSADLQYKTGLVCINNEDFEVRGWAAKMLAKSGKPDAILPITQALNDKEEFHRRFILERLNNPDVEISYQLSVAALGNPYSDVQHLAINKLGKIGNPDAIELLKGKLGVECDGTSRLAYHGFMYVSYYSSVTATTS